MSSPPETSTASSTLPTSSTTSTSTPTADLPSPTSTDDDYDPEDYPPMTTHWSAPMSCTWTYNVDETTQLGATGAVAWLDLEPVSGASTLSCYPDGMFYNDRTGVYSPGTCPGGWTTVMVQQDPNDKATTTAVCCSSEYSLTGNKCMRSVPTVLAVPITYNETASTYEVMTSSTTTLYSATIAVYTIRALFQEEDRKLLGLTGSDEIEGEESKRGLSLSAKVGIGVGVAIFALLALGVGLFFIFRKNSKCRGTGRNSRRGEGTTTMNGNDNHDVSYGANVIPLRTRRLTNDEPPPPTYEASTGRNSLADGESTDSPTRDDEIRHLRVQKAAIQRRIEELERVETEDSASART